jgi:TP901 family phage tail tape measure protein
LANEFGIKVTIDASGSAKGAQEFQRSAQTIANEAKKTSEEAKGLKEHLSQIGGTEVKESMEGITGALELLNSALGALGIGAVVIEFRELLKVGLELEDAFKHLAVASGATKEQMDVFAQSTRKLSDAFGKTQIDVAAAQLDVAKSGFADTAQNAKVTAAALELSKIGFVSTATAADTLTRVMQAYNLKADQATSVMQSLFVAAKNGKIDIGELGNLFSRMGSDIQAAGISINDVLASVSALGKSGESGYRALFGIQEILQRITETTPATSGAFQDFQLQLHAAGIQATSLQDLVGQRGLQGALAALVQAAHGNQDVLGKILGSPRAATVAIQLVTTAAKAYGETISDLANKQKEAAEADKQVSESAAFLAETFRTKIENSLIGLASKVIEELAPMFSFLNDHFQGLEDLAEILATVLLGRLVVAIVATGASMLATAAESGGLAAALRILAGDITLVDLATAPLLVVLGAAVAVLAALAAGLAVGYFAYNLFTGGLKAAEAAWATEIDYVSRLIDKFHELSVAQSSAAAVAKASVIVGKAPGTVGDATTARSAGTDAGKTFVDTSPDLLKTYEAVRKELKAVTDAQTDYATAQKAEGVLVDGGVISHQEQVLALQKLKEAQFKASDALLQYSDKLAQAEGKYDPVLQANQNYVEGLRKLHEAYAIAGGSAKEYGYTLDQLRLKHEQDQIAARAKVAETLAVSDASKNVISVEAKEEERQKTLQDAVDHNRISREKYNLAMEDSTDKINKALIASSALTSGELKLREAQLALSEAETKADDLKLGGDARAKFLEEYADKVAQAKMHTDSLGDAVDKLAEKYDPLLKAQHDYADTLQRITDLEKEKPEMTSELEQTRTYASLDFQKQQVSSMTLPADEKASLTAANDYATTVAHLNEELQQFSDTNGKAGISQQQFNQALLEAKEDLAKAQGQYDDYTKAVMDGGQALDQGFTSIFENLGKQGETLRKLFYGLAQQLEASAAKLLTHKLEESAFSDLANSKNSSVARFGLDLLGGAGLKPKSDAGLKPKSDGSPQLATAGLNLSSAAVQLISAAHAIRGVSLGSKGGTGSGLGAGLISDVFGKAGGGSTGDLQQSAALQGTEKDIMAEVSGALGSSGGGGGSAASTGAGLAQTALSAYAGHGGGGGSWAGLAASILSSWLSRPTGGPVGAGQSALVGERGPEMVTFGSDAHVHSNDQVRQAVGAAASSKVPTIVSSPQVHVPVQVVNVDDPNKVPAAMQGDAGQRAIINVLSSNRSQVKSILG